MKGKQLAILLLLVVVIGGVSFYVQKGSRSSWSDTGAGAGGKVINLPLNDVARITIKEGEGEANLVRKDDTWTVAERADYPANFEKVSDLLRKSWDLKTVQSVKVGPSQYTRLDLIEPGKGAAGGTLVDFKDKDGKRLEALLLGKKHMKKGEGPMGEAGFPAGRYVVPLGKQNVSLVSEAFEDAVPKPEQWLKKDFIKIENLKSIQFDGTTDAQHWKVTRESPTADWVLAEPKPGEEIDKTKVGPFGNLFSFVNFTDVLAPDAKPEDTGLDKAATAILETMDGLVYTLKIGKAKEDSYPVTVAVAGNFPKERTPGKDEKPEDKTKLDEEFKTRVKGLEDKLANEKKYEGRPYLIAKFTVEGLLKDRTSIVAEKKPEPAPGAPGVATPPLPGFPIPPSPGGPVIPVPVPPAAKLPPAPKVEAVTPPVAAPPMPPATPAPAQPGATPIPAAPPAAKPAEPAPVKPTPATPVPAPPVEKAEPKN